MDKPILISYPKLLDKRGNLSFIQAWDQIPFEINRAYWIYNIPRGEYRDGHAFKEQQEFIIALSGSFDIVITDREGIQERFRLQRSDFQGLYIPAGYWRTMENFEPDSLSLHLASTPYNPTDYIEDFSSYLSTPYPYPQSVAQHTATLSDLEIDPAYSLIDDCRLIILDEHYAPQGSLTPVEYPAEIPFDIERIYFLYNVPQEESRGAHAHKSLWQLIVAVNGSFEITLHDGKKERTIVLNQPNMGLLIVPGIWRELRRFTSGSNCLVMASHRYDKEDYIRNKEDFLKLKKEHCFIKSH